MAAAAYAYPLLSETRAAAAGRSGKHPWARPGAGLMALLAILALAVPALQGHFLGGGGGLATGGVAIGASWLGHPGAGRFFATAAALVNLCSFGLSYATAFGVPLPGNGFGKGNGGGRGEGNKPRSE